MSEMFDLPHGMILVARDHPLIFLPSGYIRLVVIEWLSKNIAELSVLDRYNHRAWALDSWSHHCPTVTFRNRGDSSTYHHHLSFADKDKAMLFKLTWCGK